MIKTIAQHLLGALIFITPVGILWLIDQTALGSSCLNTIGEWLDS